MSALLYAHAGLPASPHAGLHLQPHGGYRSDQYSFALVLWAFHPVDNSGRELAAHAGLHAVGHETRTHSRTVNKYINNKYIILWYSNQETPPSFAVFCVTVFKDQRPVENIAVFDAICSK
ncbi:hypothetical protein DW091_16570 [Eubacterium sp. AM05-23]|nr:hypothetical protein DW091_16570 [Eubacterium sp. AM05-23]